MSATRSSWAICCSSWFPHDMWQPKCWDIKLDSIFAAVLGDLATIQQWCYNGGISKFSLPSWILELAVPNSCFCVAVPQWWALLRCKLGCLLPIRRFLGLWKSIRNSKKGMTILQVKWWLLLCFFSFFLGSAYSASRLTKFLKPCLFRMKWNRSHYKTIIHECYI